MMSTPYGLTRTLAKDRHNDQVGPALHRLRAFLVPPALTMSAALAILLNLFGGQSVLRAAVVITFIVLVPGWSLLDIWNLARGWIGLSLSVALSVSLATIVALAELYTHSWSPDTTLLALAVMTIVASCISLAQNTSSLKERRSAA